MWKKSIVFLGLLKVFIVFALQVFLFPGARIGAPVPDAKHNTQQSERAPIRGKGVMIFLTRAAFGRDTLAVYQAGLVPFCRCTLQGRMVDG
jgi:hypothetical protein